MSYEVVITSDAELDLLEAAQWYQRQQSGLGHRFIDSVKEKTTLIARNPLLYQVRFHEIRFALVENFPYAIHFEIVDKKKIFIHAIFNTYRKR